MNMVASYDSKSWLWMTKQYIIIVGYKLQITGHKLQVVYRLCVDSCKEPQIHQRPLGSTGKGKENWVRHSGREEAGKGEWTRASKLAAHTAGGGLGTRWARAGRGWGRVCQGAHSLYRTGRNGRHRTRNTPTERNSLTVLLGQALYFLNSTFCISYVPLFTQRCLCSRDALDTVTDAVCTGRGFVALIKSVCCDSLNRWQVLV